MQAFFTLGLSECDLSRCLTLNVQYLLHSMMFILSAAELTVLLAVVGHNYVRATFTSTMHFHRRKTTSNHSSLCTLAEIVL